MAQKYVWTASERAQRRLKEWKLPEWERQLRYIVLGKANFFSHLLFLSFQGRTGLRLGHLVSFSNYREAKIKVSKDIFSYKCNWFDGEMIIYRKWHAIPKEKFVHVKSTSHPNPAARSEWGKSREARQERKKWRITLSGGIINSKTENKQCWTFPSGDHQELTRPWRVKLLVSHSSAIPAAF